MKYLGRRKDNIVSHKVKNPVIKVIPSTVLTGFLASVPFLAASTGLLTSGFLSDSLVRKKVSINIARKAPVIFGLLLSAAIVGANYVDSTARIIFNGNFEPALLFIGAVTIIGACSYIFIVGKIERIVEE